MKTLISLLTLALLTVLPARANNNSCSCLLTVYPSPYMATARTCPGTTVRIVGCDQQIGLDHWFSNGVPAGVLTYTTNGNPILSVSDGDIIGIDWPTCCGTGWGIAAEGPVMVSDHGNVTQTGKITLCIPNWRGVIPIAQNSPTNAGPDNLLVPPFSVLCMPPTGCNAPYVGYTGCSWRAHVNCGCDAPVGQVTCDVHFDVTALHDCYTSSWVWNVGCPFPDVYIDVTYYSPSYLLTGPSPNPISSFDTNSCLYYQWQLQ